MTACNGTSCASASQTVTVAATGAGIDQCRNFAGVSRVPFSWGSAWATGNAGNSNGNNGVLVMPFTVPSNYSGTPGITVFSETGASIVRYITVSPSACDFRTKEDPAGITGPIVSRTTSGFSVTFKTPNITYAYPVLTPGKTYHINIRNINASGVGTCPSGNCPSRLLIN
jgi:hypothetical protein